MNKAFNFKKSIGIIPLVIINLWGPPGEACMNVLQDKFLCARGKNCYQIKGFPVAEIDERPPVYGDPQRERAFFLTVPLLPETLHLTGSHLQHLNKLSRDKNAKIKLGYREFDAEIASSSPGGIVSFVISGGPGNAALYMKDKVDEVLKAGMGVVLPDLRGGRDNRPLILDTNGAREGATIPLDIDKIKQIDPLVVAHVASFRNVANDLALLINEVMRRPENKNKKAVIIGHSAGGQVLHELLALYGRIEEEKINTELLLPSAVVLSGSALPGGEVLSRWADGTLRQMQAFNRHYMNHPGLKAALDGLFDKIRRADAPAKRRSIAARLVHNALGMEFVFDDPEAPAKLLAKVQEYTALFKSGGTRALIKALKTDNKYFYNPLYKVLMAHINSGFTDFRSHQLMEIVMPLLGVSLADPAIPTVASFLEGYDFVYSDADDEFHSFDEQMHRLSLLGQIPSSAPDSQEIMRGIERIGLMVSSNGVHDNVSGADVNFGAIQDAYPNFNFSDLSQKTRIVLHAPRSGHAGFFSAGPLQFVRDLLNGNLSVEQIQENPDVVWQPAALARARDYHRTVDKAVKEGMGKMAAERKAE